MILVGDALACLRAMPSDSVHCVVTSPPYWGLRDYGVPPSIWGGEPDCRHAWGAETRIIKSGGHGSSGLLKDGRDETKRLITADRSNARAWITASQGASCARCGAWRGVLGLEPDYRLYVDHLVAALREVRRVLRPDGTLWLNLGDCYATGAGKAKRAGGGVQGERWQGGAATQPNRMPQSGLKPKDLVGIPWRVAFALQDDGWWLRRDNVWSKRNGMPESVTDRCTSSHEYLFHLTKSARYYYDAEAIKEPSAENSGWAKQRAAGVNTWKYNDTPARLAATGQGIGASTLGQRGSRNKRSVWSLATAPFAEAHFATFPPLLVEPCILAGTSARGVCPRCEAPWERVVAKGSVSSVGGKGQRYHEARMCLDQLTPERMQMTAHHVETIGWRPTCKCGPNYADPIPAVVLDPFLGAGTTALVAARLGREWIGIELSPGYADMARRRLGIGPQLQKAA
jgi:DNA modification methylase